MCHRTVFNEANFMWRLIDGLCRPTFALVCDISWITDKFSRNWWNVVHTLSHGRSADIDWKFWDLGRR